MSCTNDCRQPAAFPKTIDNRPGLSTIDYRIGSYADLREHMLSRLDESTVLAQVGVGNFVFERCCGVSRKFFTRRESRPA